MSTASQFLSGNRVPKQIKNVFSSGGTAQTIGNQVIDGVRAILSGALTAGALKTVLSISGPGRINFCAAYTKDVATRSVRLKVTLDGTAVFDATVSCSSVSQGLIAIGMSYGCTSAGTVTYQPVSFNNSCLVEISSSLSETDSIAAAIDYEVH